MKKNEGAGHPQHPRFELAGVYGRIKGYFQQELFPHGWAKKNYDVIKREKDCSLSRTTLDIWLHIACSEKHSLTAGALKIEFSPATVTRHLNTLVAIGYLLKHDGRYWVPDDEEAETTQRILAELRDRLAKAEQLEEEKKKR